MQEETVINQTDYRYYRITLIQDLFDDWIVIHQWGGLIYDHHQETINSYNNYDAALLAYTNAKKDKRVGDILKSKDFYNNDPFSPHQPLIHFS